MAQSLQDAAPVPLHFPAAQSLQDAAPVPLHFPAAQSLQDAAPEKLHFPAGQSISPLQAQYLPAAQSEQPADSPVQTKLLHP